MLAFSDEENGLGTGGTMAPDGRLYRLDLEPREEWFEVKIEQPGNYALFTEHRPEEFEAELRGPGGPLAPALQHKYKPNHEHDQSVTSVGLREEIPLERMRLQYWLQNLLSTQGQDIFRFKGVLNILGMDERMVLQGVHMLSTQAKDRPWEADEPRISELVFIGRNLDAEELRSGFLSCRARSGVKQL
jgi:G3E family GTPase